ncbi:hypothetical protein EJ03DRAFT_319962 [Teratosphaeria nubilosa]|uniref:Large ribosomal subunit protein mL46 n=1 Tax=Teratosphaeria nubilosa TaxID=161662 RepID=A0A6G1KY82_9PEZI|nr:hypothetical protein EJ03DRAFT_319962 [Teratosphaeria nubilosa]
MNAGQKSARRVAGASEHICTSCRHRLAHQQPRRHAGTATAAAAATSSEASPPPPHASNHIPPVTSTAPRKAYQVKAAPVLSRPPLITRDLTSFEKAFYLYQKRLNERLALPFTRYFYYKRATPAGNEWKRKIRARKTPARDIGVYNAYSDEGWNDEVLVGDRTAEPDTAVEALVRDAEGKDIVEGEKVGDADTGGEAVTGDAKVGEGQRRAVSKVVVDRPMPRVTEADHKSDLTSLNRKLDRSLYLLVKNREEQWRFPEDRVWGKENLAQAAERVLIQSAGLNMNTWLVGAHPVGHYIRHFYLPSPPTPSSAQTGILTKLTGNPLREEFGEKVFFMKARIMTGQADVSKSVFGDTEFVWLTKEEVRERVHGNYWSGIRNMLAER